MSFMLLTSEISKYLVSKKYKWLDFTGFLTISKIIFY
jgi:hypothetical protein